MSEIILSVEEMEKTYVGGVHAVRGVSFEVKEESHWLLLAHPGVANLPYLGASIV